MNESLYERRSLSPTATTTYTTQRSTGRTFSTNEIFGRFVHCFVHLVETVALSLMNYRIIALYSLLSRRVLISTASGPWYLDKVSIAEPRN